MNTVFRRKLKSNRFVLYSSQLWLKAIPKTATSPHQSLRRAGHPNSRIFSLETSIKIPTQPPLQLTIHRANCPQVARLWMEVRMSIRCRRNVIGTSRRRRETNSCLTVISRTSSMDDGELSGQMGGDEDFKQCSKLSLQGKVTNVPSLSACLAGDVF
jgi:hypothetical protein